MVELNPSPELTELLAEQSQTLFFAGNSFESNSLAQALPQPVDLVFACTNQPEVNQAVAKWAKSVGALVNCADAPEASDFANGASFQVEGFTVVVSSNGRSPGEAAAFKARLQELLNGD